MIEWGDTMSLKYRILYDECPQYHNTRTVCRWLILLLPVLVLAALFLSLHYIDVDAVEAFWLDEDVDGFATLSLLRVVHDRGEELLASLQIFCKSLLYER